MQVSGRDVPPRAALSWSSIAKLAQKLPEMSKQIQSGEIVGTVLEKRGWAAEPVRQIQGYIAAHTDEIIQYTQQAVTNLLRWLTGAWVIGL